MKIKDLLLCILGITLLFIAATAFIGENPDLANALNANTYDEILTMHVAVTIVGIIGMILIVKSIDWD